MSEAWFGWQLARHPPAYRRPRYGPALPPGGQPPSPRSGQPEPPRPAWPELTRPAGMALIITGAVLLLAVSLPLPFLNVKLLGLIMIVAGLVRVRALQRASSWLWRNRREVMTALDAPPDETAVPRVPLDTLLGTAPGMAAATWGSTALSVASVRIPGQTATRKGAEMRWRRWFRLWKPRRVARPAPPAAAGTTRAEQEEETRAWQRETGYRPNVNQMRHEPMPASHHAPSGQQAEIRNQEHAAGKLAVGPSRRAPRRGPRRK